MQALSPRLCRVRGEGWQVLQGWMAGPGSTLFWDTLVVSAMQVGGKAGNASPGAFLAVVRDMTE